MRQYIPSLINQSVSLPPPLLEKIETKKKGLLLTWAVETLASSDIKDDPSDGEQDPPAVVPIELCESARGICGEEQRRNVPAGHPRVVASFVFFGGRARDGGDGKENALESVEEA